MKAIFSPGPSYSYPDPEHHQLGSLAGEYAGWVSILDLYRQALEELGYQTEVRDVPKELVAESPTVARIASYDLVSLSQGLDCDLFLGTPGYSLAQMFALGGRAKKVVFVWNNADPHRDRMLKEEYARCEQPYDNSPIWRWINRMALTLADHVVACSPYVKKTHAELIPADKISIAFWGVDSKVFTPAPEEPPGFRILFVGGDPVRKGLIYLLRAFHNLKSAHGPEAELWVAGCNVQVDLPGVRVLGMIPFKDMPQLYPQCHVVCIPTLEDGISLAIQEGMASGLVPITTPDPAEVFQHGFDGNGFCIPYRNHEALADVLVALYANPDLRRDMARRARALAETQTWSRTKEDFKEILSRVISGGPLPFESEMPWRS